MSGSKPKPRREVQPAKKSETRQRVLIVDDDWSMRQLLKSVFELSGFEVQLAKDEAEFRDQALNNPADAIILDIMLADRNGVEIYNRLIEEGLDRAIPVVFLSALAEDRPPTFPQKDRRYSLVGKPFDPQKLVDSIREVLSL